MDLPINTLLEWTKEEGSDRARVERVLWSAPINGDLVLIALFDQDALPSWRARADLEEAFTAGNVRRLEIDPYATLLRPDEELPKTHCARRDEAWAVIAPIIEAGIGVFQPKLRGPLVGAAVERTSRSKRMIYWYLRRYWQAGQTINALLPRFERCGGRGKERQTKGIKLGRPDRATRAVKRALAMAGSSEEAVPIGGSYLIGPKDFENFRRGWNAYGRGPIKLGLPAIFKQLKVDYYHRGYVLNADGVMVPQLPPPNELPTLKQFQHWHVKQRARDPEKASIEQEGRRRHELRYRALLGDATQMAFGPGSIYQIDSTTADLYLVSSLNRTRIVGRPILYLLVDVFSHLIVGFYLTLEPSSYLAAVLGIEHAASDKIAYGHAHGVTLSDHDWPCQHLPEMLLADRGELEGYQADGLVKSLNIRVSNTAPHRADLKAIVERRFRSVNDTLIHWLDGAVVADRERGDPDYRLDATLTLKEFRTLMIYFCLDHNRGRMKGYRLDAHMMADDVQPRPNELWEWGVRNRSGHLRGVSDPEVLRANLLPSGMASVTPQGLRFQTVHYTCEHALAEGWFVRGRKEGRWKVPVSFDPRSTDVIYLRPKIGARLERCVLTSADQRFAGRDWREVKDMVERDASVQAEDEAADQQAHASFRANVNAVVERATQETAAARLRQGQESKRARTGSIKVNQRAERELERRAGTTHPTPPTPAPNKIVPIRSEAGHGDNGVATLPLAPHEDETYVPPPSRLARLRELRERPSQQPGSSDDKLNPL